MTALEVAAIIEAWAPPSLQEPWDNSGFCVGWPQSVVQGVLICLDVTSEVIEEALALDANMIISHHPLIFHGIKQLNEQNETARIVAKAIRNNLVLYSAHTNADKVVTGVSGVMAEKLNLYDIEVLHIDTSSDTDAQTGLGLVGNLQIPQAIDPFLETVKNLFHLPYVRISPSSISVVRRVALCGGNGSSLIPQAEKSGADIFLTGDLSYHHFFSTEGGMMIADIGHYESEIGITQKLAHLLSEKNVNFAVSITKHSKNRIRYF